MAAHLVCLTNDGGVPLFTRSKGDVKSVSLNINDLPNLETLPWLDVYVARWWSCMLVDSAKFHQSGCNKLTPNGRLALIHSADIGAEGKNYLKKLMKVLSWPPGHGHRHLQLHA